MMNKVILIGRLTQDPELRKTESDKSYSRICIAVQRQIKNAEGEYETDFINITTWGATADHIAKYEKKGDLIAVSGRIEQRKYKDKDGNNKTSLEVIADRISFLATGKRAEQIQNEESPEEDQLKDFDETLTDDDLPF